MSVLSLLTDFGLQDGFIGVMKGVIWGICPEVHISDISHQIEPQNVLQGALILMRVAPYFPSGSVHVAVIDPGVGTDRRALAAQLGDQYYVAPDNGLLSPLIDNAKTQGSTTKIVSLTNKKYWLENISNTFHGRDIFAPVGAYLASGINFTDFGEVIDDPVQLELVQPVKTENGWRGQILSIDTFGNLQTNINISQIKIKQDLVVQILNREIEKLSTSFGYQDAGDLIAVVDSEGYIEVAIVNGNAAKTLGANTGDSVEILSR